MSIPRYYIEKIASVQPNKDTGIVKITFAIDEEKKAEDVVQLIVSAGNLQQIFQTIGETMQNKFGGNMRGQRSPGGQNKGGKNSPSRGFKDLTK